MQNNIKLPVKMTISSEPIATSHKSYDWYNSIMMSVGFGILFFGTNTFMNFAVPILGDLGSICMAVVNYVNSFSNFLVPTVISFFGSPEKTLFVCTFSYLLYIGNFSYIIPPVAILLCACHGFLSAMVWASQGIILGNNSSDSDRGKKSGIFLSIYMFGSAIGNFVAAYLVKKLNIGSETVKNGWNGSTSVLFLFLAISAALGIIPISCLKKVKPLESKTTAATNPEGVKEDTNIVEVKKEEDIEMKVEVKEEKKEATVCQQILGVFKLAVTPRMCLLLFFFFNDGYQQVFVTSQFTRQIIDLGSVGTVMGVYSITDVLFSFMYGFISDRFGHAVVVTIATLGEMSGLVIAWYANSSQGWLNILTGVIFSLADAGFQTECLATINQYFVTDRTQANSVFRMVQCFGFAIALTITPLFISSGEKHSSPAQFFGELLAAFLLALFAYIGYMVFQCKEKKTKHN